MMITTKNVEDCVFSVGTDSPAGHISG